MSRELEATYYVSDGYATGDRPKRVKFHLSEFGFCASTSEIEDLVYETVEDHFQQNISYEIKDVEEVVLQIVEALRENGVDISDE